MIKSRHFTNVKTYRERSVMYWLLKIQDLDIKTKAISYHNDSGWKGRYSGTSYLGIAGALEAAFDWDETEEGYEYWNEISEGYR